MGCIGDDVFNSEVHHTTFYSLKFQDLSYQTQTFNTIHQTTMNKNAILIMCQKHSKLNKKLHFLEQPLEISSTITVYRYNMFKSKIIILMLKCHKYFVNRIFEHNFTKMHRNCFIVKLLK